MLRLFRGLFNFFSNRDLDSLRLRWLLHQLLLYPVECAILPLAQGYALDGLDELAFHLLINLVGGIKQVGEELGLQLFTLANL